ncbi:MAG: SMC-Scp complex subunit ScpB [Euryarchaeota archaeon]|jgi:segregation and condensation protein B|nr:SMC-Scp complex subunit ScpB [Euryarchaeota archaeon]
MSVKEDRVVESLLFSAGKPLGVEEIQETTGLSPKHVTDAIEHLMQSYNLDRKDDTSLEIVKAGNKFIMQVKKTFTDKSMMVAKPEIRTDLLKTLALIAFHQPVKQSNLRHMIGERIYGDVDQLMSLHLVHSEPHGATEVLTTTRLFPEYFGIDSTKPEEIREFLAKKVIGHVVKEKQSSPADEEDPSSDEQMTDEKPPQTQMKSE